MEVGEIYDKRIILITRNMRQMTVTHIHFKGWPDFGVPVNSNEMVKLSSKLKIFSVHFLSTFLY